MAWARTALSLISFGFALSNVFAALHEKDEGEPPLLTARAVGTLMIAIGLVSLAMGAYENRRAMNELRQECPGLPRSMATILSAVLAILGFTALVSAYLRG
jgi:putative membrane protein